MYVFKIEQGKELEDRCSVGTMTTTHIHTHKKKNNKEGKEARKPTGSRRPCDYRDSTPTIEKGSSRFSIVRTKEMKVPLPVVVTLVIPEFSITLSSR